MLNQTELPPHIFFCTLFKTMKLQRSIKYQGPKIWNSLDLEIKKSKSLKSFNKMIIARKLSQLNWNNCRVCVLSVYKISIKFVLIIFNYLLFIQQDVCVCVSFLLTLTLCVFWCLAITPLSNVNNFFWLCL